MSAPRSDTLVFFGATGDLAYKKIFRVLQAMVKRGNLPGPVIGVAKGGRDLERLRARARDSLEKHGGLDAEAFVKLCDLLRYVDGDYNDEATYQTPGQQLGAVEHPAYYRAIPPAAFGTVVEHRSRTGCTRNARVVIEKPFGRDLASARKLNGILPRTFDENAILRIDHYPGLQPAYSMLFFRFANSVFEPFWNRSHVERSDHHGGGLSRSRAGSVLRGGPRGTGRCAKPTISSAGKSCIGIARPDGQRVNPRRNSEGAEGRRQMNR